MSADRGESSSGRPRPGRWLLGRGWWVLPALLSIALSLPWLYGERWYSDAPYYQAIATQMAREGTWLSPMQGDIPYFNKPPLAFWVHGALVAMFGQADWASHLPECAGFVGMCVLTAWLVRRFHGSVAGVLAGCVMALTNDWIIRVSNFKLDTLHTLLLFGAIACWVRAIVPGAGGPDEAAEPSVRATATPRVGWFVGAGLLLGAALLTKPFYGLGSAAIVLLWMGLTRRWTRRAAGLIGASCLIGLALAAPWYGWMIARHGEAFLRAHIHEQTVERAMGHMHDAQGWSWYVRLIAGTLDESVAPARMWPIYGAAIVGMVWVGASWKRRSIRDGGLLAAIWLVAWFVALSLFGGKRNYYLLILHPATAWLGAIALAGVLAMAARVVGNEVVTRVQRALAALGCAAAIVLLVRAPLVIAREGPTLRAPERVAFMDFIRSQHAAGRAIYDCGLSYRIASLAYMQAGVWPKVPSERTAFTPEAIPAGGLMAYSAELLGKHAFGTFVDPRDTLVFRSTPDGQFLVYERHAGAVPVPVPERARR